MYVDEFDFQLPPHLIKQSPILKRDESKLLILDKKTGKTIHEKFNNIIDYLNKDDVLVLNDTKVLNARLNGIKEDTLASIELLLLEEISKDRWMCLAKPAKRVKEGTIIKFSDLLKAKCVSVMDDGIRVLDFFYEGIFLEILDQLGEIPLPPYIHEKLEDKNRYQTVYAKTFGSVAAPTAGLHFTEDLLEKIKNKGIKVLYITLHVGLGTFRPVNELDITKHKMHSEYYQMSEEVADILNEAKKSQKNIVAVGTTTTRTLETIMNKYGEFRKCFGHTDIFIYPGYQFRAIDSLITNFHLPKSTLLMLVCAFYEKEKIMETYKEAIKLEYSFFSFGDSMFIKK